MKLTEDKMATLAQYVLALEKRSKEDSLWTWDLNGKTKVFTAGEYLEQIERVARALNDTGITKNDKVAIFSNTRHEWSVCDLAATCVGAVVVPLYPNMTTEDLSFILNHSQCKLIFVDNRSALRQLMVVKEQCPNLKTIIVFDPPPQKEPGLWMSLNEFISGMGLRSNQNFDFTDLCKKIKPEDPLTIVYTSGTTGEPKGVLLTHSQVLFEIREVFAALQITAKDHTLSFLPYSHVLGRIEHWGHLVIGYKMTYSSGIDRLSEELPMVEPTVIVTVPRIIEKMYTTLKAKIETSIIDKALFEKALKVGQDVSESLERGKSPNLALELENQIAKLALFDRLKHQLFGSKLRFVVCGGAALNKEILRFFHVCGIPILEGYGLTETTGAICVNRIYDFEFGTVGKPLYQVKVKVAPDGEIWVKSPTTMKEYYSDSNATTMALKDGWLSTGDIGEITPSGRLIIKDRKKDLIKTANGKYVAPQKLESLFKQLSFISHAHIHGDQKNYIVALLTLNRNFIFAEARDKGISFKSVEDLKGHPLIKDMIRKGVAQVNLSLASHESIKNYAVLSEDFSIESGEVTPSLKVKRRVIDRKYKELLDSLYD